MRPPLGLRPPGGLMRAPQVAWFCSALWPEFTPALTAFSTALIKSSFLKCSFCRKFGGNDLSAFLKVRASIFRSEEHTSELQSLMRISYAVFCLKKTHKTKNINRSHY